VCANNVQIIVGILTGSLGILAEAAHSALDLVAALVTLVAVRLAGKPADHEHHYARKDRKPFRAFETLLLLVTWRLDHIRSHPASILQRSTR